MEPSAIKSKWTNKLIVDSIEEWDWKIIGSWKQKVSQIKENEYISFELEFYKPMKDKSSADIKISKSWNSVNVSWSYNWSLPFFLFFLKSKIKSFVEMDFQRGLIMLKELCESWKLETSSEVIGLKTFPKQYYIALEDTCDGSEMQKSMKNTFWALLKLFEEKKYDIVWNAYAEYLKSNLVKNIFTYRACFPVSEETYNKIELNAPYLKDITPEFKSHVIRHHGDYKFMWNARSLEYMYPKWHGIQVTQKKHPLEVYIIWPHNEQDTTKYQTDIYIPLK